MKHARVYVALLSPKTLMRRHTVEKGHMAFPSFFKCTGTPTADLFALLIRRPTEGEFVFILFGTPL